MSTPSSVAYVVPKILWDKVMSELKDLKKSKGAQSGGGVSGVNSKGTVNTNDLMHSLAVNM